MLKGKELTHTEIKYVYLKEKEEWYKSESERLYNEHLEREKLKEHKEENHEKNIVNHFI